MSRLSSQNANYAQDMVGREDTISPVILIMDSRRNSTRVDTLPNPRFETQSPLWKSKNFHLGHRENRLSSSFSNPDFYVSNHSDPKMNYVYTIAYIATYSSESSTLLNTIALLHGSSYTPWQEMIGWCSLFQGQQTALQCRCTQSDTVDQEHDVMTVTSAPV